MKGLIYDMDGVIVLTEDMHKKAFDKTLMPFGVESIDFDWDNKFIGKGNFYILTQVFSEYHIRESVYDWVLSWVDNYQELIKKEGVALVPGFLKFNNSMPYSKIVATGGIRKNSEIVLELLNLDYGIVSSEDIINPKPDPEIFIKAAERLGIDAKDCTVFEDSIYGIQAAKRAGARVIALTTTHSREELMAELPDLIIDDYINFDFDFFNTVDIKYPQFEER